MSSEDLKEDIKDLEEIIPRLHRKYRNALDEIINEVKRNSCIYEQIDDDDNIWRCSNCKEEWYFEEGSPKDNNVNYCPECGVRIDNIIEFQEEE